MRPFASRNTRSSVGGMRSLLLFAFLRTLSSILLPSSAISPPGARRRVKSLWERDFCVKCDEAHFGARVLGPLGTRVPDSRASPDHFWDGGKRRTLGFPQEDQSIGTGWRRRRPGARHRRSTGIGAAGEKAVGKLPRHVAKTWWNAAAMAADLTVVEDHRQRVGKDTDH